MRKGIFRLPALAALAGSTLLLTAMSGQAQAAPFEVTSTAFKDGGMLARKNAAEDPMRMCGGENVSPPLAWSGAPAKTKSFAIFMLDPDGLGGLSVSHWVAYDIPADVTSLAEGEAGKATKKFVGGKGTRDNALYIGPCPPVGEAPHHYIFTVVALDLEPGALKPGLTRAQMQDAFKGHALGGASIVGRFAR
jgi:Raf kinase inhibitor-like YbhB/YbcL family protein